MSFDLSFHNLSLVALVAPDDKRYLWSMVDERWLAQSTANNAIDRHHNMGSVDIFELLFQVFVGHGHLL